MELHMQFILNQDGELIITDEAEEAFDLDETDEWDFERTKVRESRFWEMGNAKSQNQSGRQDLNLRPFGPQPPMAAQAVQQKISEPYKPSS